MQSRLLAGILITALGGCQTTQWERCPAQPKPTAAELSKMSARLMKIKAQNLNLERELYAWTKKGCAPPDQDIMFWMNEYSKRIAADPYAEM
jgi:hypothetical protein